ncbi:MAG: HDIG domain-containing protein, partial [Calditrichaeota bacterium]
ILDFFATRVNVISNKKPSRSDTARLQSKIPFQTFREILNKITRDIYSIGILNVAPEDLPNHPEKVAISTGNDELIEKIDYFHNIKSLDGTILQKLREYMADEAEVKAGYEIISKIIHPNLFYMEKETNERIKQAVARVPIAKGTVLEKEKIIDSHEKITKEHIQKLRSLAQAKAERGGQTGGWTAVFSFLGKLLMVVVGLSFIVIYLYSLRRSIFEDPKKLLMIAISILLVLFIGNFISKFSLSEFLIPVAICAMLLTIFFDTQVAFMGTISLAVLLAGLRGNEFSITLITLVVGSVSILSVRKVRSRSWLFKSFLWVSTGYIVAIGTLELLRYSNFEEISHSLFYGLINGFLSPILAYGLMVIFEYTFDMTTDATLLELSDLNKPLLRQLAIRAPGTYHHSILVGSLAEAAAEAVGANSLLARVGAYYHDIGKMEKPEYFVENQVNIKNPHEKLSPSMSCLILVSHVKRGLEIAQEYGLPKEIQAFISEHHGTNLISYFYNKALEMNDGKEVQENDFRYPGPKPQSKETGIVMLADAVEAACRTLKDPSVSRLRGMVSSIIDDRFKKCELDESPLTLRDLNQIQEAFLTILTGIFHGRIEYPDQEQKEVTEEPARPAPAEKKKAAEVTNGKSS